MLTERQWLWVAKHHKSVRRASLTLVLATTFAYALSMLDHWWDQGKAAPVYARPDPSWMARLNCQNDDVGDKFIPTRREARERKGNYVDYVPDRRVAIDARPLYREFYSSETVTDDILDARPECIGALIADLKKYPNPYAISIVDRVSGERIFRIAKTTGYLGR